MALWNPFRRKKPVADVPAVETAPAVSQSETGAEKLGSDHSPSPVPASAVSSPPVPPPAPDTGPIPPAAPAAPAWPQPDPIAPPPANLATASRSTAAETAPPAPAAPVRAKESGAAVPAPPPASPIRPSGPPATPPAESEPARKTSLFGKFRNALKKTVQILNTDIRDLVGKDGRLVDDEFLDELYTHLVKTDMGIRPAGKIRDQIKSDFRGRKVHMADLIAAARETIYDIMHQEDAGIRMAPSGPTVIMVVGVNGSGKTTSIAKLTARFASQGKSVVLGAGDTFRAAAVEQLTIWSQRLGARIIHGKPGADPSSVAFRAVELARNENADICIIDTAGRLQTQTNLMEELGKIRRVIGKVIPDAPHEVLLVLDATAGQNGLSQAKGFSAAAHCTGIVLAKLDGTARGGVAIPIREEFGLPVKFVGLGEKPEDLEPFNVEHYIRALFEGAD